MEIQIFWKYRSLFLNHRVSILLGVLALLATNVLAVSIPWLVKEAVDSLQHPHSLAGLSGPMGYLMAILGVALLMLFIRISSRYFLLGTGRKLEYDLRNQLYQHLLKLPPSYYLAKPTGELMSHLTNDVTAIRYLTGGGIMLGVNTLLAYVTTFPMMALLSPKLTLFAMILYPIGVYFMRGLAARVKQRYYQVQDVLGDISTVAQENFSGMMVIQSYAKEPIEQERFNGVCQEYFDAYQALIRQRVWLFLLVAIVSGVSLLIVLGEGGREVIFKEMNLGGFIAFTLYLERLSWPTMSLGWTLSIFQQGAASLERIDEVLSVSSPAAHQATELLVDAGQKPLRVQHLTFSYQNPYQPTPTEAPPVLQNIQLEIPPGATVAIVGPVGAGKSTLLSLFPRLYEVPSGTVFIGDQDITRLQVGSLRQAIAYMPQHNFLFSTTITRNIAFGDPDIPNPRVVEFAEVANLHEEVLGFQRQYQTLVGERGVMLSGGQRQRITLARTLLVETPILILDDPFSHLDADTERQIIQALKERKVLHNKTTLFATHRFSLVKEADWVVLMERGQIVATGTHEALLNTQSLYQKLNRLEQLRRELGEELDGHPDRETGGLLA